MTDEEFARFVSLLHSLSPPWSEAKSEIDRERALKFIHDKLPELPDDQLTALAELEKEYVRGFENELRRRGLG